VVFFKIQVLNVFVDTLEGFCVNHVRVHAQQAQDRAALDNAPARWATLSSSGR
jgi:hypothetical protein